MLFYRNFKYYYIFVQLCENQGVKATIYILGKSYKTNTNCYQASKPVLDRLYISLFLTNAHFYLHKFHRPRIYLRDTNFRGY